MTAERVEVDAQLLNVHRHVRHRLRPVDQHQRACGVGHLGHLANRIDGSEHVRDMRERDELGLQVQEDLEDLQPQQAIVRDGHELQVAVLLLDQELPRHEVGMVLHLGQDDGVAAADVAAAPRVGDEVDRLRGVPDEDDLGRLGRIDQPRDRSSRPFIRGGRPLGDLVDATVDVRGIFAVVGVRGIDDGLGLEAGGRRVEIDELLAVAVGRGQDREVGTPAAEIRAGRDRPALGGSGGNVGHRCCRPSGRSPSPARPPLRAQPPAPRRR